MRKAQAIYDRIIITGASSGLGMAFARTLASRTRELWLIARRESVLTSLKEDLEQEWPSLKVLVFVRDLSRETDTDSLCAQLKDLEKETEIDSERPPSRGILLINNAGRGDYGTFETGSRDVTREMLRLNMESLTLLCHAAIPAIKRQGGGIINISSLAALLPIPDFAVYAASKAYVESFTEALRLELKEDGIPVLAVCPGPVSTGFGHVARRKGFSGDMMPGKGLFYTATKTVIKESLAALKRERARVFPGKKIRLAAWLLSVCPLWIIRVVMGMRPRRCREINSEINTQKS